jgi:hypothetical protein
LVPEKYAKRIRERMGLFQAKTKTTYSLVNTFVSTFGVTKGIHSEVVDNEVTANDLFE